ncbi:MAG: alpha-ketoacid dehydrogenase subunit beta [Verrucomicrobia bacterium]|nr:alpha-ketoacid dehydrogenase subunit beta [Verrucomicrobiota bacterium]MBU1735456.1 alpha-ketoacid dehydrogenase subunit beta [Verrucomicrobiota bacterium]MBU1856851.1 alpha-ketoacid dehydrogenase subunit beta [Verrucomicrobiota bacterium]
MRNISFCEAVNEALMQEMERDSSVVVYGIGVPDHKKVFGTTRGLLERFGPSRCFDTPLCEEAMTGFGLGAAINGLRPVHVHIRVDFLLLAMNQLVNMVSCFAYETGGKLKTPLVIRAIVGRGLGQGSQHSKSLHSYFSHIPGLKVVIPTTPRDAKGLMIAAIRDNNPVVYIEHRWLHWAVGEVPEEPYEIPIGESQRLHTGDDVTLVGTSWMNVEALKAAEILDRHGVGLDVIDPRTIAPFDDSLVIQSVLKTGRCIVADNDWVDSGFSAEVAARVSEKCFGKLKSPVLRMGFAHTPCPTVRCLENGFYPNASNIIRLVEHMLNIHPIDLSGEDFYSHERHFKGPF